MKVSFPDKSTYVAQCLELAILLEVSAEKPGNVNLVSGFEGTKHMHFLASAVAAAPHFRVAAERGVAVSRGRLSLSDVGVGSIIKNCVSDINAWQSGGNTLLGTVILLAPIAVAAGMTPQANGGFFEISELRRNLRRVVGSTTPEDAVAVYEAIAIAQPSGLGNAPDLDVNDPSSVERIIDERISLYHVFKIASSYDMICSEWVNGYPVTFDFAYPKIVGQIRENRDLNMAIIHTFLEILSAYPDTFIARKAGIERAKWVSAMAAETLKHGGLKTVEGRQKLKEFDNALRRDGNLLNPGTTADIIAAALALTLLGGYKP